MLCQCRFPVWDDYTAVVLESVLVLENYTGVFKEEGTPYLQVAHKSSIQKYNNDNGVHIISIHREMEQMW